MRQDGGQSADTSGRRSVIAYLAYSERSYRRPVAALVVYDPTVAKSMLAAG